MTRRFLIFMAMTAGLASAGPVRLIFDTDLGNDIDDALALAMIHALESRGEVKMLAVTVTKDNRFAAPYCDVVNHFYGRGGVPMASKIIHEWPGPIVLSGFEIGNALLFPASSIEHDFAYVDRHPVAGADRAYKKMPYDRPTWDLTAVLFAVRPDRGYFSLSEPGRIEVQADGRTVHHTMPGGQHRYLKLGQAERGRTLEALIQLASQPR